MTYKIQSLQGKTALNDKRYLVDSNIWIKILAPQINKYNSNFWEYCRFFESITNNTKAKIVLPSLLVSEVINAIMRKLYMEMYIKQNKIDKKLIPPNFYKETYRGTTHFLASYSSLCYEFKNYHNSFELIQDGFGDTLKSKHVFTNPPVGMDYNDYIYYILSKKGNFTIVTDDKDFFVEDVEILTLNEDLLTKKRDNDLMKISKNTLQ